MSVQLKNEKPNPSADARLVVRLVDRASLKHIKPRQHQLAKANRTHLDVSQKSRVGRPTSSWRSFSSPSSLLPSLLSWPCCPLCPIFNAGRASTCMNESVHHNRKIDTAR